MSQILNSSLDSFDEEKVISKNASLLSNEEINKVETG